MSVSDILDGCRAGVTGCNLVAFIDLESSMVLSVSSQSKQRQERLDTLGATASRLLPMPQDDLAKCLAYNGTSGPQIAILLSMNGTTAFVRSQTEPHEALCCSCSPNTQVDAMIEAAHSVLSDISASE